MERKIKQQVQGFTTQESLKGEKGIQACTLHWVITIYTLTPMHLLS